MRAAAAWLLLLPLLLIQGCAGLPEGPPGAERSMAERVAAEGVVALPLTIRQGYPLAAGTVNGRAGHFMLDTGTPFRFFLNHRFAPVAVGPEIGRGQAGSGQPIVVRPAQGVTSLTLGGMREIGGSRALQPARPDPAAGLVAADFGFLQAGPVPDFLGFVGAPWLSTWAFSLRYSPARWLMADTGAGAERLQAGSDLVALVRLEGQDGPLPYATFHLDGVPLRVRFDTGTPGMLHLSPGRRAQLERSGALRCQTGTQQEPERCQVAGLRYGAAALELDEIATSTGPVDRMTLGAALLARYVSVWNLSRSTIDLRRDTAP